MKFKTVKDHFDNGFKSWDGYQCPKCWAVHSPERIKTIRDCISEGIMDEYPDSVAPHTAVCPSCYFYEGEAA